MSAFGLVSHSPATQLRSAAQLYRRHTPRQSVEKRSPGHHCFPDVSKYLMRCGQALCLRLPTYVELVRYVIINHGLRQKWSVRTPAVLLCEPLWEPPLVAQILVVWRHDSDGCCLPPGEFAAGFPTWRFRDWTETTLFSLLSWSELVYKERVGTGAILVLGKPSTQSSFFLHSQTTTYIILYTKSRLAAVKKPSMSFSQNRRAVALVGTLSLVLLAGWSLVSLVTEKKQRPSQKGMCPEILSLSLSLSLIPH